MPMYEKGADLKKNKQKWNTFWNYINKNVYKILEIGFKSFF